MIVLEQSNDPDTKTEVSLSASTAIAPQRYVLRLNFYGVGNVAEIDLNFAQLCQLKRLIDTQVP